MIINYNLKIKLLKNYGKNLLMIQNIKNIFKRLIYLKINLLNIIIWKN